MAEDTPIVPSTVAVAIALGLAVLPELNALAGPATPAQQPDTRVSSSLWEDPTELTAGAVIYSAIAACGTTVHVAQGSTVVYYRRSTTEGASWDAWRALGDGVVYLERPVACDGDTVAVTAHRGIRSLPDILGTRPVGDVWTWISTDGGETFDPPVKVSSGAASLRVSTLVSGDRIATAWMQHRGEPPGTWDVHFRESTDRGRVWGADTVIATGVGPMGAQRPTLGAVGETLIAAWMDGRDRRPACPVEAGAMLPECMTVYARSRVDGRWQPLVRATPLSGYAGRPALASSDGNVLVVYDRHDGRDQKIEIVRSTDNGVTWSAPERLNEEYGADTHAMLEVAADRVVATWRGVRNGRQTAIVRESFDSGRTWTPEVLPFPGETEVPMLAVTSNYLHALVTAKDYGPLAYSRRRIDVMPATPVATDCVETPGDWGPGPLPDGWPEEWFLVPDSAPPVERQSRERTWTQRIPARAGGRACTWTASGDNAIETETRTRPVPPR